MKIAIGSDHGGVDLKAALIKAQTKTSLDETDLIFRCIVTDARGFSFTSDKALLTVKKGVPKTGDTFRPEIFGLLALAALAGVVTAVRKRRPE